MAKRRSERPKSEFSNDGGLPSAAAILAFVGGSAEPLGAREIARAFRVAGDGELVVAAELPTRRSDAPRARIVERLGSADAPHAISRLTIAGHGIPTEFPTAALAEAAVAGPVEPAGRVDLRDFELVTIDGS